VVAGFARLKGYATPGLEVLNVALPARILFATRAATRAFHQESFHSAWGSFHDLFSFSRQGLRSFRSSKQLREDCTIRYPSSPRLVIAKGGANERNSCKPQSAGSEAVQDLVVRSLSPLRRPVAHRVPQTLFQPMNYPVVDLLRVLNAPHKSQRWRAWGFGDPRST
jgi:hypothetical protein